MDDKVTILQKLKRFHFIFLGIFFGILFWFAETVSHVYLFNGGDFIEHLLYPEFIEYRTRVLMGVIIMIFSTSVQFMANKRDKTERALMESEENLWDLFESAKNLIQQVDANGNVIKVNKAWREALGYTEEEALALNMKDFIHPDHLPMCGDLFKRIIAGEDIENVETIFVGKDGHEIIVEGNVNGRFENGEFRHSRGFFHDITEQKKAEEALMESEERFRSLFEYIVDPVFLADPRTRQVVDCNNQAVKMMEHSKKELFSMKADELHPEDVRERTMEAFRKQAEGELHVVDTEVLTKSGKRIPVSINTSMVEIGGKPHMVGIFRDITEQKKAEEALQKSEEKYRLITESSGDLISKIDLEGNYIYASPSHRQLGYTEEDLMGISGFDIVHPDDVEALMKVLVESLQYPEKESSKNLEFRIRDSEGNWHNLESTANFIFNEAREPESIVLVSRDVTEHKEAEEALLQSEEKFRSLFESSRDAIMTLAPPDWRFTSGNPSTIEMFNAKDEEEFTSKGPWDVSPEEQPDGQSSSEKAKKAIMMAMETGSNFFEWSHKRLNGEVFPCTVLLTRMETGEGTYLQATVRDITEQKDIELKLEQKNQELEDYTYTVSHDLKAPLVTIQGFAELLNKKYADQLDDKAKHYLERITQGTDNLGRLVSDLLELSRAGRKTRDFELFGFDQILESALAGLEMNIQERKVKVSYPDDFPKVRCDEMRLDQVMSNLIGNAVNYMGEQEKPRIDIGWKENCSNYIFWIKDNGIGIKEKDRERIFKVFERASDAEEGSGIGLSIVKKVIQTHGGEIWVESEPGKGSTFSFRLPKHEVST